MGRRSREGDVGLEGSETLNGLLGNASTVWAEASFVDDTKN